MNLSSIKEWIKKNALVIILIQTLIIVIIVVLFINNNNKLSSKEKNTVVKENISDKEKKIINEEEIKKDSSVIENATTTQNNNESNELQNIEQSNNDSQHNTYVGKYTGVGSDAASKSYIEILDNNVAYVNINHCEGWSLYKGEYYFGTAEYTGEDEIYINKLSIIDGDTIDVPDTMVFSIDNNKLFTLIGFLGSNNFDCAVQTDFIKN